MGRSARSILRIALREFRDRRGPKPHQRLCHIIGIALKIASQVAGAGGHGHGIGGLGEMVDANLLVAMGQKQRLCCLVQPQAFLRCGHGIGRDHLLPLAHPRHMGIAIKGHPIWRKRQKLVHRIADFGFGLMRQAKQNVSVQAAHPPRADHAYHITGQFKPLHAPNGFLDFGVKILHANRGAVHSRCGQGVKARFVNFVGVNLHRKLCPLGQGGHVQNPPCQIANQSGGQHGWRAPAPMQARQGDAFGQVSRQKRNLGLQHIGIGNDRIIAVGALCAAGAKPAQAAAKWDMNV